MRGLQHPCARFLEKVGVEFSTQASRWDVAEVNCAPSILGGWGEVSFGEAGALSGVAELDCKLGRWDQTGPQISGTGS